MDSHLRSSVRLAGIILLCGTATCVTAAPPPQVRPAAPPVAPGAVNPDKIVQQAGDFLRNLKSFSAEVTVTGTAGTKDQPQQEEMLYTFALSRPNHYALRQATTLPGLTIVCDGDGFFICNPAQKKYSIYKAPASSDAFVTSAVSKAGRGSGTLMLWALGDNPASAIREGSTAVKYRGVDSSTGTKCHRLRLEYGTWAREMWIQAEDKPLIRKITISRTLAATAPDQVVSLANWTVDTNLPASTFRFAPPQGAKNFDFVRELEESKYPAYSLKGKAAPPMMLPLLGGGQLNLASLKGNVVVLDFWATWCPPCRKGLPILDEVAREYKDKGVRVFAINCAEAPAQVSQFATSTQLQLPIALDATKAVGQRYHQQAIPQTVIIDKNGIVQWVEVGLPGNAKQVYKATIEALLAGKDLVGNASSGAEGEVSISENQP